MKKKKISSSCFCVLSMNVGSSPSNVKSADMVNPTHYVDMSKIPILGSPEYHINGIG